MTVLPALVWLPALNSRLPSQVLDLDETLVHCSTEMLPGHDFTFSVNFNGEDYTVYVRKRPYFEHFLSTMSKLFEIVVCSRPHNRRPCRTFPSGPCLA